MAIYSKNDLRNPPTKSTPPPQMIAAKKVAARNSVPSEAALARMIAANTAAMTTLQYQMTLPTIDNMEDIFAIQS